MTRSRAQCQICNLVESKYTCSKCPVVYCSVPCYKLHQASSCAGFSAGPSTSAPPEILSGSTSSVVTTTEPSSIEEVDETKSLRPLTSLNWPYVPEGSAYPDPLKRDDPKPLQLAQYETIATSPSIRKTLAAHPRLPSILASIDKLRGPDRENALQHALGVNVEQLRDRNHSATNISSESSEDVLALRELAEAVEAAVRGGKDGILGLDWGE